MARVRGRGRRELKSEINIVPLLDVLLVLLPIFMVTAPIVTQSVEVDLSDAAESQVVRSNDDPPVTVEVFGIGQYNVKVGQGTLSQLLLEQVIAETKHCLEANEKMVFLIGGAKDVPYDEIIKTLNLLHSAEVKLVSLMTRSIQSPQVCASAWRPMMGIAHRRRVSWIQVNNFWEPIVSKATEQNDKLKQAIIILVALYTILIALLIWSLFDEHLDASAGDDGGSSIDVVMVDPRAVVNNYNRQQQQQASARRATEQREKQAQQQVEELCGKQAAEQEWLKQLEQERLQAQETAKEAKEQQKQAEEVTARAAVATKVKADAQAKGAQEAAAKTAVDAKAKADAQIKAAELAVTKAAVDAKKQADAVVARTAADAKKQAEAETAKVVAEVQKKAEAAAAKKAQQEAKKKAQQEAAKQATAEKTAAEKAVERAAEKAVTQKAAAEKVAVEEAAAAEKVAAAKAAAAEKAAVDKTAKAVVAKAAVAKKTAAAKEADGVDDLLGDLSSGKDASKTGGGAKGNNASAVGSGNTKNNASGADINNYAGQMKSAIESKFYDASSYAGKTYILRIRLVPNGLLLSIQSEGGDLVLCQAVLATARQAKFPKPPSQVVYEVFKNAPLDFKPQ